MPELTLRDGMVIVGSLLILAVVIDALRRMRQQRSRVKVKLAGNLPDADAGEDLSLYRELPNGGARVIDRRGGARGDEDSGEDSGDGSGEGSDRQRVGSKTARTPGASDASAGGDGAAGGAREVRPQAAPAKASRGKRAAAAKPSRPAAVATERDADTTAADDASRTADAAGATDSDDEVVAVTGMSARDDEPANLDWLEDLPVHDPAAEESPGELPRTEETEVIVLHVVARDGRGFSGQDILEILLACDMRFGDMDFFHRHEQQAGRGPIQFSVANMLKPGVFDIDNMESMRTRGLVFFVTLPGPEDMLRAFDYMLETARAVARNLGGELLDESRSVLTQQAVEHSRQQIRELDRRLRVREA